VGGGEPHGAVLPRRKAATMADLVIELPIQGCKNSNFPTILAIILLQMDVLFELFYIKMIKSSRCIFSPIGNETYTSVCNICHFSTSRLLVEWKFCTGYVICD
jgi:hypothetical protein